MVKRQVAHWSKMLRENVMPQEELEEIWKAAMEDGGKSKGPVHMIVKLFQQLGIKSEEGRVWEIKGINGTDVTTRTPSMRSHRKQ